MNSKNDIIKKNSNKTGTKFSSTNKRNSQQGFGRNGFFEKKNENEKNEKISGYGRENKGKENKEKEKTEQKRDIKDNNPVKRGSKQLKDNNKNKLNDSYLKKNSKNNGTDPKNSQKTSKKDKIVKGIENNNDTNINYNKNKNMGNSASKEDLKNENKKLLNENDCLKKELNKLQKLIIDLRPKNDNIYNPEYKYNLALEVDLLKNLLEGWKIRYKDIANYESLKKEKMIVLSLIGFKNTGKSFLASKIAKDNLCDKSESNYLYLKYITKPFDDFRLAIIDTPGFSRFIKKNYKSNNIIEKTETKIVDEMEKNILLTDNFLLNFVLKKSDFLIVVVGTLNLYEQQLLNKLKSKDEEHKEAFKEMKRIFVIHNLKELSKKEEVKDHIKNVMLNSMTFKLEEKETQLIKEGDLNKNSKFFIEKHQNKEIEIYHLILARDKSEAGNYYNDFTYDMIWQQYNYFHAYNSFDLISEIKKEIITVSEKIFVNPLKSLDDFENTEDKIKVKKGFDYISNSDENTDFSFIKLKPKYSYYKVDNNTKLLVVIEMPGKILNQKLSCSAPKNGFYSMKFSGKKIIELPQNCENEKKNGLLFNNREEGEFKEVFKIKQDIFSLSNYKPIKEENEKNGVYKYYFELMGGNASSDEDDK